MPMYPEFTAAPPGQTKLDHEAAGRDAVLLAEGEPQAPAGRCPLGGEGWHISASRRQVEGFIFNN